MRVVVVGATGNVGSSLLEALAHEPLVESVLGISRRPPEHEQGTLDWARADIGRDELLPPSAARTASCTSPGRSSRRTTRTASG